MHRLYSSFHNKKPYICNVRYNGTVSTYVLQDSPLAVAAVFSICNTIAYKYTYKQNLYLQNHTYNYIQTKRLLEGLFESRTFSILLLSVKNIPLYVCKLWIKKHKSIRNTTLTFREQLYSIMTTATE